MKIEIIQDHSYTKPKIVIYTDEMTDQVQRLVKNIQSLSKEEPLLGKSTKEENIHFLNEKDIIRIYASDQKVFITTAEDEFTVKERLYELEEKLGKYDFVRISKSEIINKSKILKLDLSIHGTICVYLEGNQKTYVSRRYVKKIKEKLGL